MCIPLFVVLTKRGYLYTKSVQKVNGSSRPLRLNGWSSILADSTSSKIDDGLDFLFDYSMINHTNHTIGETAMNILDGKYAWLVKIGEKGQFVIPKEAREIFELHPGDEILVLGDTSRGIAILPKAKQQDYIKQIFSDIEE